MYKVFREICAKKSHKKRKVYFKTIVKYLNSAFWRTKICCMRRRKWPFAFTHPSLQSQGPLVSFTFGDSTFKSEYTQSLSLLASSLTILLLCTWLTGQLNISTQINRSKSERKAWMCFREFDDNSVSTYFISISPMKHSTAMKQVHDSISEYISFKCVWSISPNSTLCILSKTTFFLDSIYNILNEQLQLQLLLNKQVICKLQNFTIHYDFGIFCQSSP